MLTAASRAKNLLGDSAELVANFVRKQINPDGGFQDRAGQSDLYYTVFGIEALLALQADVPRQQIASFLQKFRDGQLLDLVHLACLVRCWANLRLPMASTSSPQVSDCQLKIENWKSKIFVHRCNDGGYSNSAGAEQGTAYGCFLALAAHQDLNLDLQDSSTVAKCIKSLQRPDGAYANEPTSKIGSAPATAAALTILHYLNEPVSKSSIDWLLSCFHPKGGFAVRPTSEQPSIPDLLSTATVLHALSLWENSKFDPAPIEPEPRGSNLHGRPVLPSSDNWCGTKFRARCLDFLDSLWSTPHQLITSGLPTESLARSSSAEQLVRGFRGNWADETLDCEYTYYGLLALGHLCD